MKRKDIDKCQHINLSTEPEDIAQTMTLELPVVNYFFHKEYGGNNKFEKYKDGLLDKALAEEKDQYSGFSEYISHKGNRWISYVHTEFFPKAKYALASPTSFIYYETYGSCGAFFPMFNPESYRYNNSKKKQKKSKNNIIGSYIFTSHFFQRMSERTGKTFRSRELIREFVTTMQTQSWQIDEDGEIIIKFKGGYGFGVKRCDSPLTVEIRTFLADEQLSPSQRRKCEKVDAYADLVKDGMYLDDVALHTAYNTHLTPEEETRIVNEKLMLYRKLGDDRLMLLAGWTNTIFMLMLRDLLHIDQSKLTAQGTATAVGMQTREVCVEFAKKHLYYDGEKATDEERRQFRIDLADVMGQCAKCMKLRSINRENIDANIEKYASWGDKFCVVYEALEKGFEGAEERIRNKVKR